MKHLGVAFLIIATFVVASCNKTEKDPYLFFRQQAAVIEGDWELVSYKINGVDTFLFPDTIKRKRDKCDTQTIYRYDALQKLQIYFGKKGEYKGLRYITRIDTSFLPSNIIDTSCTNKYNYIRTPFDTILKTEGLWTFPGNQVSFDDTRLYIYDRLTKQGILWDIVTFSSDVLSLTRKYYKDTGRTIEVVEDWVLQRP